MAAPLNCLSTIRDFFACICQNKSWSKFDLLEQCLDLVTKILQKQKVLGINHPCFAQLTAFFTDLLPRNSSHIRLSAWLFKALNKEKLEPKHMYHECIAHLSCFFGKLQVKRISYCDINSNPWRSVLICTLIVKDFLKNYFSCDRKMIQYSLELVDNYIKKLSANANIDSIHKVSRMLLSCFDGDCLDRCQKIFFTWTTLLKAPK